MTQPVRPDPARAPSRNDRGRWLASSATWPRVPVWAVASAALSALSMTGGWLVADAVQPASYSPVRSTISVLAGHAGTDRWIMTAILLLVGGCQLVTAAGLAGVRVPARVVLAVAGLSSIGIAVSPEPVRGSTPQHLAWTALGAVAIAVWPAFVPRRSPAPPLILSGYGCAVVTAVFVVLLSWLVLETQSGSDLGLAERVTISIEICWPFIVAITLHRRFGKPGPRRRQPDLTGPVPRAHQH